MLDKEVHIVAEKIYLFGFKLVTTTWEYVHRENERETAILILETLNITKKERNI